MQNCVSGCRRERREAKSGNNINSRWTHRFPTNIRSLSGCTSIMSEHPLTKLSRATPYSLSGKKLHIYRVLWKDVSCASEAPVPRRNINKTTTHVRRDVNLPVSWNGILD